MYDEISAEITCDCASHKVEVCTYEDVDEVFINFWALKHPGKKRRVRAWFHQVWSAIRGHDVTSEEIIITSEEAMTFSEAIKTIALKAARAGAAAAAQAREERIAAQIDG